MKTKKIKVEIEIEWEIYEAAKKHTGSLAKIKQDIEQWGHEYLETKAAYEEDGYYIDGIGKVNG